MNMFYAPHLVDGYKLGHIEQYIDGTEEVLANMTPRDDRLARVIREYHNGKVVYAGLQRALKVLVAIWDESFFNKPKEEAMAPYIRRVKNYTGPDKGDRQIAALEDLYDLGYLPLELRSLPEGCEVDMQVPFFVVRNTIKKFYWLTNYSETFLSTEVWPFCSAASIAQQYYKTSKRWAEKTGAPDEWLAIANHCFAGRGHRGIEDGEISGMGHLLFSVGTDTLWAIDGMEKYYNADSDKEMIGVSVNAFEHATATQRIAYYRNVLGFEGMQAEIESLRDVCTSLYPTGIVSYVADSEDYFGLLEKGLPQIKAEILARTEDAWGLCKFVVRPDSSPKTPLEIIVGDFEGSYKSVEDAEWDLEDKHITEASGDCEGSYNMGAEDYSAIVKVGEEYYKITTIVEYNRHDKQYYYVDGHETTSEKVSVTAEMKGSLQLLWETFGGTLNKKGLKVLNPKVGIIYGEAITMDMQEAIYSRMEKDGWCVSNILMGTGSWGYLDRASRDSYSMALKGTNSVVKGQEVSMQKNPKTAKNTKKSACGLLRVEREGDNYVLYDNQTREQFEQGELKVIFKDGIFLKETSLQEMRDRLWK